MLSKLLFSKPAQTEQRHGRTNGLWDQMEKDQIQEVSWGKIQLHRANSYTLMTPQSAGISGAAYVEEEQHLYTICFNEEEFMR